MKGKVIRSLFCVALLVAAVSGRSAEPPAGQAESRFDALAKTIGPVLALGTPAGSAGNHALTIEAAAGETSGLPGFVQGARVRIFFQYPDKLRVEFPFAGSTATVCRNGQSVWAFPGSLFGPLVEQVGASVSTKPLPPFQIDPNKATLLPALIDVHDAGIVKLGDEGFRVLDLQLLPEIKVKNSVPWPVRIWIRPGDHRIAQLAIRLKDWSATVRVEKLEIAPSLPDPTWNASPEQEGQVIAVPGEKLATLLDLALKQSRPKP